jgi:hypothetical protein
MNGTEIIENDEVSALAKTKFFFSTRDIRLKRFLKYTLCKIGKVIYSVACSYVKSVG